MSENGTFCKSDHIFTFTSTPEDYIMVAGLFKITVLQGNISLVYDYDYLLKLSICLFVDHLSSIMNSTISGHFRDHE